MRDAFRYDRISILSDTKEEESLRWIIVVDRMVDLILDNGRKSDNN